MIVKNTTKIVGNKKTLIKHNIYKTDKDNVIKTFKNAINIREVSILKYLSHPNIINLLSIQLRPSQIGLPFAIKTLDDLEVPNINDRKLIFYQAFNGLSYLHNKNIIHADIKDDNILVFNNIEKGENKYLIKIADFGLASPYIREINNKSLKVATLSWRAPEILLGNKKYTKLIDIWSMGVVMLNKISGTYIFDAKNEKDVLRKIFNILKLPSKYELNKFKQLSYWDENLINYDERHKKTNFLFMPTNKDEYDVVYNSVIWETERLSAAKILKLPYFNIVRDDTYYVAEKKYIDLLYDEIKIYSTSKNVIPMHRLRIFLCLYKHSIIDYNMQILFYALQLFDIISLNINNAEAFIYAIGCMYISAMLYDEYDDDILTFSEYYSKDINVDVFKKTVDDILEKVDFNIIFPTCEGFVYQYLIDTAENITEKYNNACSILFILYINPEYVDKYNSDELAQLAISATCDWKIEFKSKKKLYTSSIKKMIEDYYNIISHTVPKINLLDIV